MKKSLLILPLAALLLAGCNSSRGDATPTPTPTPSGDTPVTPSTPTPSTTSEARPASPWSAIPTGDGTEDSPWNVTQAWEYVDKNLTETYATSAAEQEAYKSDKEYYVRGWICYIEAHSDGRDPEHPHSIKFHMADDVHYVTRDEVVAQSDATRNGFCVYFGDTDPALESQEAAQELEGKCVTVCGYLLNWGFEPEVTIGGVISDISDEA